MNMNSSSENVASRPTGERMNERGLWVSIKSGRVDSEVTSRFPMRIGAGLGDIALGVCMRIYLCVLLLIHLVAGFAGGRTRTGPGWKEIAACVRISPPVVIPWRLHARCFSTLVKRQYYKLN